ncbi:hypothetical protein JHK85_050746 [Glycine max]|nr:hypothetical protein JHK85_050746 [Glycine max]
MRIELFCAKSQKIENKRCKRRLEEIDLDKCIGSCQTNNEVSKCKLTTWWSESDDGEGVPWWSYWSAGPNDIAV